MRTPTTTRPTHANSTTHHPISPSRRTQPPPCLLPQTLRLAHVHPQDQPCPLGLLAVVSYAGAWSIEAFVCGLKAHGHRHHGSTTEQLTFLELNFCTTPIQSTHVQNHV